MLPLKPGAVLSYPEGHTPNLDAFCRRMQDLFANPAKRFSCAPPDIREVLIDGDLATMAQAWTLNVSDASGKVLQSIPDDGLDVFRRQADDTWKIHISHAFSV
jgi:hypothetical protein